MDYNLRAYTRVRRRLHHLQQAQADVRSAVKTIEQPPAYTQDLHPRPGQADLAWPADILIKNARLFCGSSANTDAVSIAIKGNRIAYVGPPTAGLASGMTRVIDAGGCSVAPGLCDAHLHLMVGAEHNQGCSVEDVRDQKMLRYRLNKYVQDNPDQEVYYVYGLHYTQDPLIPSENARQMLDEIVCEKPIFVYAHDLHTGWANSRAFEIADLMHRMPPYPAMLRELELEANLELDRDGLPSGEMKEPPVYFIVEEALRRHYPVTNEQKKDNIEKACHKLACLGLTSIHNMGLDLPEEDIECLLLLLELEAENRLPLRVHSACSVVPDEMMLHDVLHAADARNHIESGRSGDATLPNIHRHLLGIMHKSLQMRQSERRIHPDHPLQLVDRFIKSFAHIITPEHLKQHRDRNEQLQISSSEQTLDPIGKVHCKAVKLFMDGVVEQDTAFRLDTHPLPGIPAFSQSELDQVVTLADRLGLQTAAHCIGNGSVNSLLNAIELAHATNRSIDMRRGHKVRHRIEHIEMCNDFDIPRFEKMEVIASMQALHERPPTTLWHRKVPENQWATAFPWRSLIRSGCTLVFGSDWPIVSCNCFDGIQRATARAPWKSEMPDQSLDLREALAAFSTQAARAEYTEHIKGTIQPGMLADLVVLSEDLTQYNGNFEDVRVEHTVSNGVTVFSRR